MRLRNLRPPSPLTRCPILYELIMGANICTSPRSYVSTSSVSSPTTMGADPASVFFFLLASNRHTHPSRALLVHTKPKFDFSDFLDQFEHKLW